jgi:hypothetical protein
MLRLSHRPLRVLRSSRAPRIETGVRLLAAILSIPSLASAQRPPVITSVRHANTVKEILSLDWVGLYDQLESYARWWKETAACAGIPLPLSRPDSVQFYYVNAVDFLPIPTDKPDRMVAGVAYAAREQIFLSVLHLRNEIAVKHEMLHQLLFWWGEGDWDNDVRGEFLKCGLDGPAKRISASVTKHLN